MFPDLSINSATARNADSEAHRASGSPRRPFAVPSIETEPGHKTPEGAIAGAAIGGVMGAILAGVSAIDAVLTVPAFDIAIAAPWLAALAGGGVGVASGALIGALVGYAMVEERLIQHVAPTPRTPSLRRHSLL